MFAPGFKLAVVPVVSVDSPACTTAGVVFFAVPYMTAVFFCPAEDEL
jgi:hypothetical protein